MNEEGAVTTKRGFSLRRTVRSRGGVLTLTAALTLFLFSVSWLRWLAYPLVLLSTVAHELGHGLAALMVGGSFRSLKIFADGSGVATWAGDPGRLGQAFIAAGGLIGPALTGALLFALARRAGAAKVTLAVVGSLLLLANLLWVRNVFGFVFVALVAATCLALALRASDAVAHFGLVFFGVQLSLSVFSRAEYLFTDVAQTATGTMPSDTAQIAEALWLPYWFWGALCGAISLATVVLGIRVYLQGFRRGR